MISVSVYKQSNYSVSVKKIKEAVVSVVSANGVVSNCDVSVAIVGEKYIVHLAKKYMNDSDKEAREHPVLSFPVSELEGPFVFPPDGNLQLGEIIVSYPKAVDDAKKSGKLIDDVVCELARHGALHLMGIHHD
ncbi:rRNA maturation RNase YbeY [Candidatus Microgenomates bacterium]|nr:MAG: rRNA maturation RNase YbeY [Candidatus Microgenomates bacterium]